MALSMDDEAQIHKMASSNGYWGDARGIFVSLGVRIPPNLSGGVSNKTWTYIRSADAEAQDKIARYFEVGYYRERTDVWPGRGLKLFISHRDDQKVFLAKVAEHLEGRYGIVSFLAHDAIEAGKKWRDELEMGLKTMDALFAFCSPGFYESDWTGQEIGFALGKDLPIVAVLAGERAKGFLEPVQRIKISSQDDAAAMVVADHTFDSLKTFEDLSERLSEGLARKMKFAESLAGGRFYGKSLSELPSISDRARLDLASALEVNNQLGDVKADEAFMKLLGA